MKILLTKMMISLNKPLFILVVLLFLTHSLSFSQTYNHTTTSTTTSCSGIFYDAGGTGNYANNITVTQTFYPSSGNKLKFTFTSFSTENNYDALMIYNGNSTAAPLISSGLAVGSNTTTCPAGSWRGTGSPGVITSSAADGSLTFVFRSDGSTVSTGWTANIECVCDIAAEGAQINSAASGCLDATTTLGAGAYRDIQLAANTYYNFSWANNSGGTTNGYCGRIISGGTGATSTTLSGTVTNWFSGTSAPVIRVSAARSSDTWSTTSATLTYRHSTPAATTVSGGGTFCSAPVTLTASGGASGTIYWQNTNSGGNSTTTASTSQSVSSSGTYYYRSNNNGCWGNEGSAVVNFSSLTMTGTLTACVGGTTDLNVTGEADWTLPTGGTVTTVGNDRIHRFTASGTFTSAQAISDAQVLVIGGGGGGGANGGGGGGAGAYRYSTGVSIAAGSPAVTVGAGGAVAASNAVTGSNGASSVFNGITAIGGGGGASRDNGAGGQAGGSGGGGGGVGNSGTGAAVRHIAGAGTAGQGSSGGNGTASDLGCNSAGGGGGGAGGAGTAAGSLASGNGGAGLANSITGSSVNYAGGGGGGPTCTGTWGTAGFGGGSNGASGTANTGGGGSGNGGSGGSGVVIIRYTAPKWTVANGTGSATIDAQTGVVTAVSAGTVTVTYTSANGCSVSNTVTISAPSTAPTGIAGAGVSVCHGNAVTMAASGGSLSAGASYEWFTGSCGGSAAVGTLSGTGNVNLRVTPTATTSYYVRASAGTVCAASACSPVGTITLPTAGTTLATNGQSATCNVSGSNWIHFYTSGGNLIASINPNGNNLGSVTATAIVSGASVLTQACGTGSNPNFTTAALGRTWVITPTNNLSASVRFPFSASELASLVTASAGTASNALDNVTSIADIKMSHYSGVNQNGNWADNCVTAGGSGGTQLIGSQAGSGIIDIANGFVANIGASSYVQFNTPGFSEFWLHGDGGSSPLPVSLTSFSANCDETNTTSLRWQTASEQNSDKFVIEKSRDMNNWTYVSEEKAAFNSSSTINYEAVDSDPYSNVSYYRLVQIDINGAEKIYGPVSVSCLEKENSLIVFPNPSKGEFTVEISSNESISNAELKLVDVTGKQVARREINIVEGRNHILFQDGLEAGTYMIVITGKEFKPTRVVIDN